jgi:hypothetical protein
MRPQVEISQNISTPRTIIVIDVPGGSRQRPKEDEEDEEPEGAMDDEEHNSGEKFDHDDV